MIALVNAFRTEKAVPDIIDMRLVDNATAVFCFFVTEGSALEK